MSEYKKMSTPELNIKTYFSYYLYYPPKFISVYLESAVD